MTRRWGQIVGGGRVHDAAPAGRWRILTLLGAVSAAGWVATMTIEAPTDGDVFLAYLEQVLCPQLRPTHCVVMDNLAAHTVAGVRELIESTGARLLYLPAYSRDSNPIEKCWAQVKQHLRAAKARSLSALEQAGGLAPRALTADQAKAYSGTADIIYGNYENALMAALALIKANSDATRRTNVRRISTAAGSKPVPGKARTWSLSRTGA